MAHCTMWIGGELPPRLVWEFLACLDNDDLLIQDIPDGEPTLENLKKITGKGPAEFESDWSSGNDTCDFCKIHGLWYKVKDSDVLEIHCPATGTNSLPRDVEGDPAIELSALREALKEGRTLAQVIASYDWLDDEGFDFTLGEGEIPPKPAD